MQNIIYNGDDLLISVFQAVALIFETDNKYLTPIGQFSLGFGALYIGIKAMFKGDIGIVIKGWMIPTFLVYTLLFAAKSSVWIKNDIEMSAPVKIDNIPAGIAYFTSTSSKISHYLSELLEEVMLPVGTNISSKHGVMYGAKAVAKIRDIQIYDPILLRNTKEYMRQCYMMPYVLGNFANRKVEAVTKPDILGYLEENPAKCFGIKPIKPDGSIGGFQTCTDAGRDIKRSIEEYSKSPLVLSKLAAAIGIPTSDRAQMSQRLKLMTEDVFGYLDQGQTDIHEWIKQAMVLNANRESFDDWREKVGHSRVFPDLIRMQATRGIYQQALGSIVAGEISESSVPAAQPVVLSLVVMCFIIILPLGLLPGGMNYITNGIKFIIWPTTWPIFFTMIHAFGMIVLKDGIDGWGEGGLSLVGQGGFAETIFIKYSMIQTMLGSVPVISFAVVFGSGYALSVIASMVAGTGAASIGSNMADGNLSMGQRSYNNLTRGQHNEAPSLTMGGGFIDDGGMRVVSDDGGNQFITERQDQMAVNYKSSDSIVTGLSSNLSSAKSDMASLTERDSQITTKTDTEGFDFVKSIATGDITSENLSSSQVSSLKSMFGVGSTTSSGNSSSESQSTGTNSSVGVGVPSALTSVTGVSESTATNASNLHDFRK